MITINVKKMTERNLHGVVRFRPVVMTLAIENELLKIYADEIIRKWNRAIREKIVPAYTLDTPATSRITTDADGQQLQWLVDQVDREINSRILYQTEKLGRWVTRVGTYHTEQTISSVKSATGVDVKPYMVLGDVREILENNISVNVDLLKNLEADVKKRVEMVLFDAIAMRRNQKYVVKALREAMGISYRRARVIARDQTHKMNSLLTRLRNEQIGIEAYIWQTMRDDRVRRLHQERQGKVFRWSDPPSDGHPGYPINCFSGDSKVDLSNGCNNLWRRDYSGALIEVVTGNGGSLKATPNHPVLTQRGWIAINNVQEGDYLVKRVFNSGVIRKNHDDRFVTSFDNLFGALNVACGVSSAVGTEFDFHGDGTENDIDVVIVDRLLSDGVRMEGFDFIEKFRFARTCHDERLSVFNAFSRKLARTLKIASRKISNLLMSGGSACKAFFGRHFSHHDVISFRPVSQFNVGFDQTVNNRSARNTENLRNLKNAFSDAVHFFNLIVGEGNFVGRPPVNIKTGVVNADILNERMSIAYKEGSNRFNGQSAIYEFDRVINKSSIEFTGHVYNLSNDNEWYEVNGFVSHNCRCHAMAVLDYGEE